MDSLAGTITRSFDGLNRLTNESTPQGSVGYTYDTASRRATMTPSVGSAVTYTFDNANRLTGLTQGTALVGITYDAANRRNVLTLPNGITTQYGFDLDSRLQSLTYTKGGTSIGTLSYVYDSRGNRVEVDGTLARTNLPLGVSSASYDAANQLSLWNGVAATYDANGSTLTDAFGNQFSWNSRNQLSGTLNSNTSYSYDAYGRRSAKSVGTQTTSYLFDGLNRVLESAAGGNTTLLSGGLDEVFLRSSGGSSVPLVDALGSTVTTTDASGNGIASYWYSPFGETTTTGALDTNTTQFTGRENDGGGVYYYRSRYLSPVTGRFLSKDPLGFAAGPNDYLYVGANPTRFHDPLGLDKLPPLPENWLPEFIANSLPTLDQAKCGALAGLPVAIDAASLVADFAGPEGQAAKLAVGFGLSFAATFTSAASKDAAGGLWGAISFTRAPLEIAAKSMGPASLNWITGVGIFGDGLAALHDISGVKENYHACMARQ